MPKIGVPIAIVCYHHDGTLFAGVAGDPDTALHVKAAIEALGPEYKVNLHGLTDAAEVINADAIEKANAALTQKGFDPLPADAAKVK